MHLWHLWHLEGAPLSELLVMVWLLWLLVLLLVVLWHSVWLEEVEEAVVLLVVGLWLDDLLLGG